MKTGKLFLKDYYDCFADKGNDATLTYYIQDNLNDEGNENKKRPFVIICPGGGYSFCCQKEAEPIALNFLRWGMNAFVLDYTTDFGSFPTSLLQVSASYELIREKSEEWHCDINHSAIMGFSAGGHLAALYSNCYCSEVVRKVFPNSIRPFATILCYSLISADVKKVGEVGSFYNLLGHIPNETEANFISCEKHVCEDTPPAFLWHTSQDGSAIHSLCYAEALLSKNIPFELRIYPYGKHGLATCDKLTIDNIDRNIEYIDWLNILGKWIDLMFFSS